MEKIHYIATFILVLFIVIGLKNKTPVVITLGTLMWNTIGLLHYFLNAK